MGKKYAEPSEGGIYAPATYHGGQTMTGGVTVHTIFWAPSGFSFQTSPGAGVPGYEGMIKQYLSDVSKASTGGSGQSCTPVHCNAFTVEPQYAWGTAPGGITPGANTINYNPATDSIDDTHAYPTQHCTSPQDASACITDAQVQAEVDRVIRATGGSRGVHNLWYVFTPPNVDECISTGVCETTAYGGYHSLSNVGHGVAIYAYTGDPIVETDGVFSNPHPEGNPDGEVAVDIVSHETNEAMTDPEGVGYMDPNGYEVGDKCEFGPQHGTPLGEVTPPDGGNPQPYNQVINGHKYWTQEMWSNIDHGCVQSTTKTSSPLPLPQVNLTQFSSAISGNTENNTAGIHVTVKLVRANLAGFPVTVATGSGTTAANGSWLATLSGGHAVGDDRDQIDVTYSGTGAPHNDAILTGNGGNPFTESGWTGWTALDEGTALTNSDPAFRGGPSLSMGPCFQTGVLKFTGASAADTTATDFCGTASDVADTPLSGPVSPSAHVVVSSNDNRAFAGTNLPGGGNPDGALVNLKVPVGEPDSAPSFLGDLPGFTGTGFPTCTADLGARAVTCTGLVPGRKYTLKDGAKSATGSADATGTLSESLAISRGNTVVLKNSAGRTLTTLRVANLQVHITGDSDTVSRGTCSPAQYWGGPLTSAPTSGFAGEPSAFAGGGALTGLICPASGHAGGLPTSDIAQTDERSGGQTVTEVADVANTSPLNGEELTGTFTALAEATAGTPQISLSITHASGGPPVFTAANVDTATGVKVKGLKPGNYDATWTVRDANGDTRTETSRFIQQDPSTGPAPAPTPRVNCRLGTRNHHRVVVCHVAFQKSADVHGMLQASIAHGQSVAAVGHSRLHNGSTTVTMRQLRPFRGETWWMSFVVHVGHDPAARTIRTQLLVF